MTSLCRHCHSRHVCWFLTLFTKLLSTMSKKKINILWWRALNADDVWTRIWCKSNHCKISATKFIRPQPPLYCHVWGAMLQAFHQLHPKPKTIPGLNSALQQIWDDWPETTIDKVIKDLMQMSECTHLGRWWTFFEHMISTLYRDILTKLHWLFHNL